MAGARAVPGDRIDNGFMLSLDRLLDARGTSRHWLCQHVDGLTAASLWRYAHGERSPKRKTVARIAAALRTTPEERAELYLTAGFVPVLRPDDLAAVVAHVARLMRQRANGRQRRNDVLPIRRRCVSCGKREAMRKPVERDVCRQCWQEVSIPTPPLGRAQPVVHTDEPSSSP